MSELTQAALVACGKPTKHSPHGDCVGIPLPPTEAASVPPRVALSDAWGRGRHIFVDAAGSAPGSEQTDAVALAAIADLLADDGEQP